MMIVLFCVHHSMTTIIWDSFNIRILFVIDVHFIIKNWLCFVWKSSVKWFDVMKNNIYIQELTKCLVSQSDLL